MTVPLFRTLERKGCENAGMYQEKCGEAHRLLGRKRNCAIQNQGTCASDQQNQTNTISSNPPVQAQEKLDAAPAGGLRILSDS